MNELELRTTLEEYDIDVPERCISCARLGTLATDLSKSHQNKRFLTESIDPDVAILGFSRDAIVEAYTAQHPGASEEEIEAHITDGLARFKASEDYAEFLKDTGAMLDHYSDKADATAALIRALLKDCPPNGHATS